MTKLKIEYKQADTFRPNDETMFVGEGSPIKWVLAKRKDDETISLLSHTSVQCKDYVMDSAIAGRCGSAGYTNYARPYMDDYTSVCVIPRNPEVKQALFDNIHILNSYEKAARYKPTRVYETDNDGLLFVEGSVMWSYNSILQSMWLSCVRVCCCPQEEGQEAHTLKDLISHSRVSVNEHTWGLDFRTRLERIAKDLRTLNSVDLRNNKEFTKSGGLFKDEMYHSHGAHGIYYMTAYRDMLSRTRYTLMNRVLTQQDRRDYYGLAFITTPRHRLYSVFLSLNNMAIPVIAGEIA